MRHVPKLPLLAALSLLPVAASCAREPAVSEPASDMSSADFSISWRPDLPTPWREVLDMSEDLAPGVDQGHDPDMRAAPDIVEADAGSVREDDSSEGDMSLDMAFGKPPECERYQDAHDRALHHVSALDAQGMFLNQVPVGELDARGIRRFEGRLRSREPSRSGARAYLEFTFDAASDGEVVPGVWASFYSDLATPVPALSDNERCVYEERYEMMSGCRLNEGDFSSLQELRVFTDAAGTPRYVEGLLAAREGGGFVMPAGFPWDGARFSWETHAPCEDVYLRNGHRRADLLVLDDAGVQRLGWGGAQVTFDGLTHSVHIGHATGFSATHGFCGAVYLAMVLVP